MSTNHALFQVGPVLIERRCGGWLAITPRDWPLGIGVTGDTKAEAERKFQQELERFSKIREQPHEQTVTNERLQSQEARQRNYASEEETSREEIISSRTEPRGEILATAGRRDPRRAEAEEEKVLRRAILPR